MQHNTKSYFSTSTSLSKRKDIPKNHTYNNNKMNTCNKYKMSKLLFWT